MTLTRVPSHLLWLEPSHSLKNGTRLEVLKHRFSTWLVSSHLKSLCESSHWLQSANHWRKHDQPSPFGRHFIFCKKIIFKFRYQMTFKEISRTNDFCLVLFRDTPRLTWLVFPCLKNKLPECAGLQHLIYSQPVCLCEMKCIV